MHLRAIIVHIRKLLADEVGASLAEYAVVAAIICCALAAVATSIGAQVSQMFSNAAQDF